MSRRYFEGLRPGDCTAIDAVPGGLFLTRVEHVQYRWHADKPYYSVVLSVIEPKLFAGHRLAGRIYATPKSLWKLNWFLRDFGYDIERVARGEIEDRALIGLQGIAKVSYATVRGLLVLNFDAFAPCDKWKELFPLAQADSAGSEVA